MTSSTKAALLACGIGICVLLFLGFVNMSQQQNTLPAASEYFTQKAFIAIENKLPNQSTDGLTPSILRAVYPGIQTTDFDNVSATTGSYRVVGGDVVLNNAPNGTPNEVWISNLGMAQLLDNIGKRLSLPVLTEPDVDQVLQRINDDSFVNNPPKRTTLEGTYVCLPHRNTSGPQTLECALGIKATDGHHYALDTNTLQPRDVLDKIQVNQTIKATGLLVPVQQLSSDHWQRYNIRGIMSVTELEQLT